MGEVLLRYSEEAGTQRHPRNDLLNNTDDNSKNRVYRGRKSEKKNNA